MLEKFRELIYEKKLLVEGDAVVVGVSGGPDSIAMLSLLNELKDEMALKLYVVHLNHQFRGVEAEKDAAYVKSFCDDIGVESFIFSTNVEKLADRLKISFEDAGRQERYRVFEEIFQRKQADRIAVAQNKNDQAETILMHLFRGSGLDGLCGIDYIREEKIIRPLLDFTRDEIEAYCEEKGLNPRMDKTNEEAIYARNKVRLELMPYIEENFNSRVTEAIWRTGELLKSDRDCLGDIVRETMTKLVVKDQEALVLDLVKFNDLHLSIKTRMVRSLIADQLGSLKGITFDNVLDIIELCENKKTGTRKIINNSLNFLVIYDKLKVYKGKNHDAGKIYHQGQLTYRIVDKDQLTFSNLDNKREIAIDSEAISGELRIRFREPGDRFKPMGMKGSKKLKDFFIDLKIPCDERDHVPLICDDRNIIWVVGYRINNDYRVTDKTAKVALLQYSESC